MVDLFHLCAGLGLAQLAVTARFRRLFRKNPPSEHAPRAAVICACKGRIPALEENAAALVGQDYPGKADFLFVVPSQSDPAYAALESLKPLVSGKKPTRSSGKNLDLLHALERVPAEAEVLVFVDGDARVPQGWLKSLVAPLADPRVGATTAAALYAFEEPSFWDFQRLVYMGAGIPYLELFGGVTGQSTAIRKKEFHDLGMPDIWARSLMDDMPLTARLRQAGRKVRFVAAAMPASLTEGCGAGEFFVQFNRWIRMFRLYAKPVWIFGLIVTATKTWALIWSLLNFPQRWPVLALVWGMDMLNLFWLFSAYGRHPLLAALSAPILQAVYLVNFLASLLPGDIRWGGVRYRARGPQDIEALG